MADRPARTKPALHIAASLKVVAKHRNVPSVSVDEARDAIKRISHDGDTDPGARADALLREHLERSTGDVDRRARFADRSLARGRNLTGQLALFATVEAAAGSAL